MKTLRFHCLLLGTLVLLVASARIAFRSHYAEERHGIAAAAQRQKVEQIARFWNSLGYSEDLPEALADAVLLAAQHPSTALSAFQQEALAPRVLEIVEFLLDPHFERYYRIKTEGLSWIFQLSDRARSLLQEAPLAVPPDFNVEDAKLACELLWEHFWPTDSSGLPARMVAACVTNVTVAVAHTNSVRALISGNVSKGLTVGAAGLDPGFVYLPEQGGSAEKPDSHLHVSFFARSTTSTNAGPVYLSLYWSEPDHNWVLTHIVTDLLLNFMVLN